MITDRQNTVLSLSIYAKQFLNKVSKFNKLLKLLTNNKNYNPRWISQYNYLNLFRLLEDI